jgi:hypothetical protein
MTLSEGTRLGPYEILASVGALGEETSPPIALLQNWTVLLRQAR